MENVRQRRCCQEIFQNIIRRNRPFKHPNWQGSIFPFRSSSIHLTTKSFKILDRPGVRDMGLVSLSLSGWLIFATGMTSASFQIFGTTLEESDLLKMVARGSGRI